MDKRWPGPQLSWIDVHPITLAERDRPLFLRDPLEAFTRDDRGLRHYRRILASDQLDEDFTSGDVTLINWPQTDYWELPLIGVDEPTREKALLGARDLTLSFVYWMQTEADGWAAATRSSP